MAPVARRVANAEEDGPVLSLGPTQGFLSPSIPVHGIVSMLQEIRTGFMDQSICMIGLHIQPPQLFITIGMRNDKEVANVIPHNPLQKSNQMSPFKLDKKDGMQTEYVCVGKLLLMGHQNSSYLGLQAS